MNCSSCNYENKTTARFCSKCGSPLSIVEEPITNVQNSTDEASESRDSVRKGTVITFRIDKGWGFIKPNDGSENVFVHITDVTPRSSSLMIGEPVEFITIPQQGKGPKAIRVKRIEPRIRGVVLEFDRGYGKIETEDGSRKIFVHHTSILGSGYKTLEPGEDVEFSITIGPKGDQAARVVRYSARDALERFAELPRFEDLLEQLVKLAHKETWTYRYAQSNYKYPVLRSYILYTFARIEDEDKIAFASRQNGEQLACFNTGLVTEMQEEIYGLFTQNNAIQGDRPKWILQGFYKESDKLLTHFGKRPDIANYFHDPQELLYDTRINLVVNVDHIIRDNLRRFPPEFQNNEFALKGILDGAINAAKSRVRRNYKTAIPQFYRGKLQLLMPLCLKTPDRADLALVIARENEVYRGSTVLTLDMAYNNARLIARPDNEWLDP